MINQSVDRDRQRDGLTGKRARIGSTGFRLANAPLPSPPGRTGGSSGSSALSNHFGGCGKRSRPLPDLVQPHPPAQPPRRSYPSRSLVWKGATSPWLVAILRGLGGNPCWVLLSVVKVGTRGAETAHRRSASARADQARFRKICCRDGRKLEVEWGLII